MGKHKWYVGIWEITHFDKNGKVKHHEEIRNSLANEGESIMLDSFFRGLNSPTTFFIRLCHDSLDEADTLLTVQNEPVGNGYAPIELERSTTGFPTLELHDGDYRLVSKQVTFTASGGDIGPVNTAYLATTSDNSGKLVCFAGLSVERTVLDGEYMLMRYRITLQ